MQKITQPDEVSEANISVLITGANGFIAKNLIVHLNFKYKEKIKIFQMTRATSEKALIEMISKVNFIFHLAGENRPKTEEGFLEGNVLLTEKIIQLCVLYNKAPILYTSSTQAKLDNPYGISKHKAEKALMEYANTYSVHVSIFRLPNVFGKWAKPNYNSFIATLCHNISRNLPVNIVEADAQLKLVYIDDVVIEFMKFLEESNTKKIKEKIIEPVYIERLGDVVDKIYKFKETHETLVLQKSAMNFDRALSATYLSYFLENDFEYEVPEYLDARGSFYEIFKTEKNGQVSISTTKPGITRGNHFHHSKHEKFVVVKGKAIFRFRHLLTNRIVELEANDLTKKVIEVPTGYTHNFMNIGDEELIVLLWANEPFDRNKPDTYFLEV